MRIGFDRGDLHHQIAARPKLLANAASGTSGATGGSSSSQSSSGTPSGTAGGVSSGSGSSTTSTSTSDTSTSTAPVLSINGNNPATVNVGNSYTDLGATVTGPQADLNLGVQASVDGGPGVNIAAVAINTSVTGMHTIVYSATDQNGLTGTASRTVNVVAASTGNSATSTSDTGTSTSTSTDTGTTDSTATSTTP